MLRKKNNNNQSNKRDNKNDIIYKDIDLNVVMCHQEQNKIKRKNTK